MVKIQQLPNGQLMITVPKRLAELKGWQKGTVVIFRDHSFSSFIIEVENKELKKKGVK
ncbi:MAG: hypothetical protein Q7J54_08175 [Candidatus Woesearchaeota archaeon]|nr:hypothetical protein [Candidatus Woesearchaeota archaeon]